MALQFYLFRVSLVPLPDVPLFPSNTSLTSTEKSLLLARIIFSGPATTYRNKRYQPFNVTSIGDDVLYFRFARPKTALLTVQETDGGFLSDYPQDVYEWTHAFYFGDRIQVVAVCKNVDFFTGEYHNLSKVISGMLTDGLRKSGYEPGVVPLSAPGSLRSILQEAERVYKVQFEFVPPNVFGGSLVLRDWLRQLSNTFRVAKVMQRFTAGDTPLRIPDDAFVEEEEYLSAGGGDWSVRFRKDGETRTINSGHRMLSHSTNIDIDDESAAIATARELRDVIERASPDTERLE